MSLTAGNSGAFIGKFEPYGLRKWVTYYGTGNTEGKALIPDESGNVYATGQFVNVVDPAWFPTHPVDGAYNQNPINLGNYHSYSYLLKLNQTDGQRTWATVFGDDLTHGTGAGLDIVIDHSDNIIMVGYGRNGGSFPIYRDPILLPSAYQQLAPVGASYGIIASFNSEHNKLLWSTQLEAKGPPLMTLVLQELGGFINHRWRK